MLSVTLELQDSATKLFSSFKNNHFKVNPGKSYILLSTKRLFQLMEFLFLLQVPENPITELCVKVSKRLNAVCHISSFKVMNLSRTLMKSVIESYCSLIWKLHSGTLNNKINQSHERASRTVYSNYKIIFQ